MEDKAIKIDKKILCFSLIAITVFSLIFRLTIGFSYYSKFDLSYYIRWASGLHEGGFFNAYEFLKEGANSIDYPPLFLFPLYIVGFFTSSPSINASNHDFMLVLKVFQVLFDVAIIPIIYFLFRKFGEVKAFVGATLWALNPAMIINSAFWGQTDSLMILLLLLTFYFVQFDKICLATFFYCLACSAKFQCAYFAPVFLLYVFFIKTPYGKIKLRKIKELLKAIGVGAITVLAVFLPFMINCSEGIMLPFKLYFGGFGKYQYATYNAYNLYAAIGLNLKPEYNPIIGSITLGDISNVLLILIITFVIFLYFKAPYKSPWTLCFVLMQSIFMLTTRMHERYQIPVLIFSLIAYYIHENAKFLKTFFLQSVIIFINEALVFFWWTLPDKNDAWFYKNFDALTIIFSLINLVFFVYTIYLSVSTMFKKEVPKNA